MLKSKVKENEKKYIGIIQYNLIGKESADKKSNF